MVFNIDLDSDFAATMCDLRKADQVMRKLHACLLRLKRHRNVLAPVGRLPGDILTEIFLRLVEAHDGRDAGSLASQDDYPHQWVYITHVCHAWRTLALTCGALWTRIIFSDSDRVLTVTTIFVDATMIIPELTQHVRYDRGDSAVDVLLLLNYLL